MSDPRDEIAYLEAQLEHASAIAACSVGQPDRAERVADRERARQMLQEARDEWDQRCLDSKS